MTKLKTEPTAVRRVWLLAKDMLKMPETKIALFLIVVAAAFIYTVFSMTGCSTVPVADDCEAVLPGQSEVKRFNDAAGPVVEAMKPFVPSPFRELIEVVGGGLLAYGGYKKATVKSGKSIEQVKNATFEIVKGWQEVLDAGGVQLGQTVTTKYGPMTVAEILADNQGPLAAKLVDQAQGKA